MRGTLGGKAPRNISPPPDPDRWIAQKSVPSRSLPLWPPTFVLKMNDSIHHSFVHVKIEPPPPGGLGDHLNIKARKYNSLTDEWSVLMQGSFQMPDTMKDCARIRSVAFQSQTESLFVLFQTMLDWDEKVVKMGAIINYGTNSVETFPITATGQSTLLNLGDSVHVTQSELIPPSPVNMIPMDQGMPGESYVVTTIHVRSKKVIFNLFMDSKTVRKYCRATRKWSTLNITWNLEDEHEFFFKSATLTSDERQIIIFATEFRPNKGARARIMALDMDEATYSYSVSVSDIPCHGIDPQCIMRTGGGLWDEILVIGWIRILFGSSEYKGLPLPPLYLMQMVAKWFSAEMIHAVHGMGHHYAIRLDVIRRSLSPVVTAQQIWCDSTVATGKNVSTE